MASLFSLLSIAWLIGLIVFIMGCNTIEPEQHLIIKRELVNTNSQLVNQLLEEANITNVKIGYPNETRLLYNVTRTWQKGNFLR